MLVESTTRRVHGRRSSARTTIRTSSPSRSRRSKKGYAFLIGGGADEAEKTLGDAQGRATSLRLA